MTSRTYGVLRAHHKEVKAVRLFQIPADAIGFSVMDGVYYGSYMVYIEAKGLVYYILISSKDKAKSIVKKLFKERM